MNHWHQIKTPGSRALVAALLLTLSACAVPERAALARLDGYPIAPVVATTRDRSIVIDPVPAGSPVLHVHENAKFREHGYGNWHYGPGIPTAKRLDLMPAGYAASAVTQTAGLLNFFAVTDIHITDKETPASAVFFGWVGKILGGYSPTTLFSTQVLDATLQTVNALHEKTPLDFGISLGDSLNNNQYNEARWYIDVMDGKVIRPSSGSHRGEETIDYQKPYQAVGLDKAIPWYQAIGNHDHFFMGSGANSERIRQAHIGLDILDMGNLFTDPRGSDSRGFYMGSVDGATPYGDIIGVGPVTGFATPPKVADADPDRRSLSKKEWMSEFLHSTSRPIGHGFTQANVDKDFACYSFEPKSGLPLKVIVLDDTQRDDDPNVGGYGHSSLDKQRYDWLISELDRGQAEGKLMIIAAHMPIGVGVPGHYGSWSVNSVVTEETLIARLHQYPNLVLWLSGHRHINDITAFKSPDPARPELGFWQVETSSLKDFPQQFRTFELVRNSDNTISIRATNVDPAVKEDSLAARSRSYAIAAQQIFKYPIASSYNAELVKQLSSSMQVKMQNYRTP
jgi:metallophosphoesterase (TIGR03768 family)